MSSTQAAVCLGHLGQGTSGQGQPRDPGGDHEQTGGSTRGSEEEQESAQLWKVMGSDLGHPRAAKEICFDKPVLTEFALPANSQPLTQGSAEIYFNMQTPSLPIQCFRWEWTQKSLSLSSLTSHCPDARTELQRGRQWPAGPKAHPFGRWEH